jgi:hypothetical protein
MIYLKGTGVDFGFGFPQAMNILMESDLNLATKIDHVTIDT